MFQKQLEKYVNGKLKLIPSEPMSLTEIYLLLEQMHLTEAEEKSTGAGTKVLRKILSPLFPKTTKNDKKRLEVIRQNIKDFGKIRQYIYESYGKDNEACRFFNLLVRLNSSGAVISAILI